MQQNAHTFVSFRAPAAEVAALKAHAAAREQSVSALLRTAVRHELAQQATTAPAAAAVIAHK